MLEDVLKGGLEQAVAHLVSVAVVPGQVLEADLRLAVAIPLPRREPLHGVLRSADEGGCDRDLVLCAGGDVEAGLPHDGHIQVVHQGHFQAFGAFVVITVVEGLNVEEHRVAVVLAGFSTLLAIEMNTRVTMFPEMGMGLV